LGCGILNSNFSVFVGTVTVDKAIGVVSNATPVFGSTIAMGFFTWEGGT
jgi:hypothetical protein